MSLALVAFEEPHLPMVLRWINDPFVRDAIGTVWPVSMLQHREWYADMQKDRRRLTMVIQEDEKPIGLIGLGAIDLIYRNAELWLYLGEAQHRRKHNGREALSQMLRLGFETIGLHRIYIHVHEYNEVALQFFRACGFQDEGRHRDAIFKRGRFYDKLLLSVLDREFKRND